jgi:small GTP-binding protein
VALIGDGGVGKTSLVNRFVKGQFDDRYIHTIGTNVKKKTVLLTDEKAQVTLMVWDMQGQRNDPTIIQHMFHSEGAIIVCDVTRDQTFNNMPEWIALLEKELGRRVPMVLLGNKADLEEQALIGQSQLQYMAGRYGASYHLTSARTGHNVEESFTELARRMVAGK